MMDQLISMPRGGGEDAPKSINYLVIGKEEYNAAFFKSSNIIYKIVADCGPPLPQTKKGRYRRRIWVVPEKYCSTVVNKSELFLIVSEHCYLAQSVF
jgi:hypothetical protein